MVANGSYSSLVLPVHRFGRVGKDVDFALALTGHLLLPVESGVETLELRIVEICELVECHFESFLAESVPAVVLLDEQEVGEELLEPVGGFLNPITRTAASL